MRRRLRRSRRRCTRSAACRLRSISSMRAIPGLLHRARLCVLARARVLRCVDDMQATERGLRIKKQGCSSTQGAATSSPRVRLQVFSIFIGYLLNRRRTGVATILFQSTPRDWSRPGTARVKRWPSSRNSSDACVPFSHIIFFLVAKRPSSSTQLSTTLRRSSALSCSGPEQIHSLEINLQ